MLKTLFFIKLGLTVLTFFKRMFSKLHMVNFFILMSPKCEVTPSMDALPITHSCPKTPQKTNKSATENPKGQEIRQQTDNYGDRPPQRLHADTGERNPPKNTEKKNSISIKYFKIQQPAEKVKV